jgi:hypothetical protein
MECVHGNGRSKHSSNVDTMNIDKFMLLSRRVL